jgi:hypothetical protein
MRAVGLIAVFLLAAAVGAPQSRSFSGEIMDSQCAGMGSHDKMMQGVDAKTAADCSRKCVALGGKYVLFDRGAKAVYQIDDQNKAASFAGQKVKVKGTLDAASKTIHVESVDAQ